MSCTRIETFYDRVIIIRTGEIVVRNVFGINPDARFEREERRTRWTLSKKKKN
jgi:hypothetical protein